MVNNNLPDICAMEKEITWQDILGMKNHSSKNKSVMKNIPMWEESINKLVSAEFISELLDIKPMGQKTKHKAYEKIGYYSVTLGKVKC